MTENRLDAVELLFWTLMRRFEARGLEEYRTYVPGLALPEKVHFVERLQVSSPSDGPLVGSVLEHPIEELFVQAEGTDETSTLIKQGLLLERLGQSLYGIVEGLERVSAATRSLAAEGRSASATALRVAAGETAERIGTGDDLFATFAEVSEPVLQAMDGLGDPVDRIFAERFELRFADVMAEFTADLVTCCQGLGMERRKVVAHLTAACMGL